MCWAVIFWIPLQCQVSAGLVILCKYTPIEFTIIKSRAMTVTRSSQCRAISRAVMDEKSLSPLFPVMGVGGWGGQGQWLQMTGAYYSPIYLLGCAHIWVWIKLPPMTWPNGKTIHLESLIRVYTVCHSVFIFWMHFSVLKQHFWTITSIFWDVKIFSYFYGILLGKQTNQR